ncbi:MiaB/RimO family radical SAM methylthiotransferase [bacterium]|nr:MiaB/RimO family radical SAM methylthiotransferase [bacterium]
MKVSVRTFGCKVNRFESEQLISSIRDVVTVSDESDADVFVVNGCSVTATADSQIRNIIRRLSKRGRVIVTGCYARNRGTERVEGENIIYLDFMENVADWFGVPFRYAVSFSTSRPFIKIQDGCPQFCSYCIIPHLRGGKVKSVPIEQIEQLAEQFATQKVNELVLTGIHIGTYGRELQGNFELADAVEAVYKHIPAVRMGSLESAEVSDRIFGQLRSGVLLPHLHIPLQSGSNAVLKRMNRPDTAEIFRNSALKAIESVGKPGLGCDVIVGFPGESDSEFQESYDMISSLPFSYGHVFPFSARKGTPAFQMEKDEPVSPQLKKERAKILRELLEQKKDDFMRSLDGIQTTMILEKEADGGMWGTTERYLSVFFQGEGKQGSRIPVTLSHDGKSLIGTG